MITPQGVELLKFDRYNGEGYLNVHINSFMTIWSDYHNLNFVLVKLFFETFKETTIEWYSSLLDYSIKSFNQLMIDFCT